MTFELPNMTNGLPIDLNSMTALTDTAGTNQLSGMGSLNFSGIDSLQNQGNAASLPKKETIAEALFKDNPEAMNKLNAMRANLPEGINVDEIQKNLSEKNLLDIDAINDATNFTKSSTLIGNGNLDFSSNIIGKALTNSKDFLDKRGLLSEGIKQSFTDAATKFNMTNAAKVSLNDVQWTPNQLNDYRGITYNFRLVATASPYPTTYDEYVDILKKQDAHVIIMESGGSKYNITSVNIVNKVGGNWRQTNTFTTNVDIDVSEPLGVSLIDSFRNAAQALKIDNFCKMFYFLELKFIGYDEDGNILPEPVGFKAEGSDSGNTQRTKHGFLLYRLSIKDIEMELDETGSKYRIRTIPLNEQALDNLVFRLASPENVKGGTMQTMFDSLAESLNQDVKKRYTSREIYTYKIICHDPELAQATPKTDGDVLKTPGDKDQQAGRGRTISDFILSMILNSGIAEKYTRLFKTPEEFKDNLLSIYKLYSEVKYKEDSYDPTIGDYYKDITYHIYKYDTILPMVSKSQEEEWKKRKHQIVSEIIEKNQLCKRYDYIYTGRNTEILGFDIKMNFNWASLVNVFDGELRGYATTANGQVYDADTVNKLKEIHAANKMVEKSLQAQLQLGNDNPDLTTPELQANISKQLAKTQEATRQIEQLEKNNLLEKVSKQDVDNYQNVVEESTKTVVESARYSHKTSLGKVSEGRYRRYAEDIIDESQENFIPITFHRNPQDLSNNFGQGNMGGREIGKAVMSSVFDQSFGMVEKELQKIQLDIKGDTFWLGNTDMDNAPENSDKSNRNHPFNQLGDHYLLLTFKYPVGTEDDGTPIFEKNNCMFNGIYAVNSVTSTFSGGKFTQSLTALRVPVLISMEIPEETGQKANANVQGLANNDLYNKNLLQNAFRV